MDDDDNERDAGLVFAIPDLYAPSRWFDDVEQPPEVLSRLKLDGLNPTSIIAI